MHKNVAQFTTRYKLWLFSGIRSKQSVNFSRCFSACFGSSALLVSLSFIEYKQRYAAVAVLTLIVPIAALFRQGYSVNPQDIAPR